MSADETESSSEAEARRLDDSAILPIISDISPAILSRLSPSPAISSLISWPRNLTFIPARFERSPFAISSTVSLTLIIGFMRWSFAIQMKKRVNTAQMSAEAGQPPHAASRASAAIAFVSFPAATIRGVCV